MNSRESLMRYVIERSVENVQSGKGGPFAAIVVKNGKIVAEGTNLVTSQNDPTAHAEVTAIRNACKYLGTFQLEGCDIYTSCEPCPMCLGAIYWARPERIFYGNTKTEAAEIGFDDTFIYEQLEAPPQQRKIPMYQLLDDEASIAFKTWEEKEDKIEY